MAPKPSAKACGRLGPYLIGIVGRSVGSLDDAERPLDLVETCLPRMTRFSIDTNGDTSDTPIIDEGPVSFPIWQTV